MELDFLREAEGLADEIIAIRHAIHRCPELGNREYKTSALIAERLADWDFEVERTLDTAVVGRLRGALPGPCVALRADMDALPLQEVTGAAFASENPGVMHACGHDVHVAAALGAARLLSLCRARLRGSVVFLFQPDEEGNGGAKRMLEAGALTGVDAVFGAHVSPELPLGCVGVRYGKFYAASDMFHIVVEGKSAHGAEREKGIDALAAGAELVTALLALPGTMAGERCVLTVGKFSAGAAGNIVAARAELDGILRTLGPRARETLRERVRQTARDVASRTGTRIDCRLRESYPGVVNDDGMTRRVHEIAADVLGPERVRVIDGPTMTTEDFGYLNQAIPGTFYHIGAGCSLPLHNPGFLPDDRAAVIAAALHAAVLTRALNA